MVWGTYFILEYLDPWGLSTEERASQWQIALQLFVHLEEADLQNDEMLGQRH